jgi:hypothetical protein
MGPELGIRRRCLPRRESQRRGDARCLVCSLLIAVAAVAGCREATDRLAVGGKITLNGEPLDNGSIRFSSREAASPMSAGAMIQDGAFFVPQDKGLRVGSYLVEISAPDTKAPPVLDRASGMKVAPERIPAEYNVDSRQTIDVTAEGDNQFDFDISSKAGS